MEFFHMTRGDEKDVVPDYALEVRENEGWKRGKKVVPPVAEPADQAVPATKGN